MVVQQASRSSSSPSRRSSGEDDPRRQRRGFLLSAPSPLHSTTERDEGTAELGFRSLQRRDGNPVQISIAPDRTGQATAPGRVFHHPAEQLSFDCMDADVIVCDALRIDQAADHDTRTSQRWAEHLVVAN